MNEVIASLLAVLLVLVIVLVLASCVGFFIGVKIRAKHHDDYINRKERRDRHING